MIVKLHIDYNKTPTHLQRSLADRLFGSAPICVTENDMMEAVKTNCPIMASVLDWNRCEDESRLIEQQVVIACIRNVFANQPTVSPAALIEICKAKSLEPIFYYTMHTFNAPIFDIVFVLEKPITNPIEREKLLTNLVKAIPQCAPSAIYEDEIIEPYNVQKIIVCDLNARVKLSTLRDLVPSTSFDSIQEENEKWELQKYKDNPIVKIIRLEVDSNGGYWEAGAEELNLAMAMKIGAAFPGDISMLGKEIINLVSRLKEIDGITHTTINRGSKGGRKHIFKKIIIDKT